MFGFSSLLKNSILINLIPRCVATGWSIGGSWCDYDFNSRIEILYDQTRQIIVAVWEMERWYCFFVDSGASKVGFTDLEIPNPLIDALSRYKVAFGEDKDYFFMHFILNMMDKVWIVVKERDPDHTCKHTQTLVYILCQYSGWKKKKYTIQTVHREAIVECRFVRWASTVASRHSSFVQRNWGLSLNIWHEDSPKNLESTPLRFVGALLQTSRNSILASWGILHSGPRRSGCRAESKTYSRGTCQIIWMVSTERGCI